MSNPWDTFLASGAELVAGQLIARVDGKHTVLGHVNLGQLILTEDGQAYVEKPPQPAVEAAPKPRRGRAAASDAMDNAPADAPADAAAEPAEGQTLTLGLSDDVSTAEQLSGAPVTES